MYPKKETYRPAHFHVAHPCQGCAIARSAASGMMKDSAPRTKAKRGLAVTSRGYLHFMATSIRVIQALEEFFDTVTVQREVWGFSDTDIVPPRLMTVSTHIGGLVLGAYHGEQMIGFSLAMPGVKKGGQAYWHSHMTGVLPSFQNQGIGRQLKLKQREEARRAGIDLIEWTFDPLEIRNSHFNLERLGVIVRRFVPNQYGITSSRLHGGLPTDRLMAEWHVNSPRVQAIVDRGETVERRSQASVQVPLGIDQWRSSDVEKARHTQDRIRAEFLRLFGAGLAVVGYQRLSDGGSFELGSLEEQPVAVC
jgi:predicted GNAT superfamily acetyltransferase